MKRLFLTFFLIFSLLMFMTADSRAQTAKISLADKLHSISRFWQEVNYNFVFLDKVDRKAWDSLYRETLTQAVETKDDFSFYRLMDKLCAYLKDGHTNIIYPRELVNEVMITHFAGCQLFLTNIDNRAIVTRVSASKKKEIPLGTEITKVNGIPTQQYMDLYVKPYISSSTGHVLQNQATFELLRGYRGSKFQVELKFPDGSHREMTFEHQLTTEKEVYPVFKRRELLDHKILDGSIHYIALNSFGNDKIDTLFTDLLPGLYGAKAIILDLRYNGGGNTTTGFSILQYFTSDTLLYGSKSITREHIPAYKAWGTFLTPADTLSDKPEWDMTKAEMTKSYLAARDLLYYEFPYAPTRSNSKARRIEVPVVVLIGNNTASAAEDFLIYADPLPNFTFIGDKTYGSTGQPYLFDLPCGGKARVCTKKDIYPSGKEFVGVGVLPDIYVRYTLQDYQNDQDPVLAKAIEFLTSHNRH